MSYQPIYATLSDDVLGETGHTSSRRGKVSSVTANVLSELGDVCDVHAHYINGTEKITRPKFATIPKGDREEAMAQYTVDVLDATKVKVHVDFKFNPHFELAVNGVRITDDDLKMIRQIREVSEGKPIPGLEG